MKSSMKKKLNKKIGELVLGFIELPNIQECYEPLNKVKKEQEEKEVFFEFQAWNFG